MTNTSIAKALSALEVASMTAEERRLYFARMAALSDEKSLVNYNLNKGREEGREEGKIETLRNNLRRFARKRFADLDQGILQKIDLLESSALEALLDKFLDFKNVREFELEVEKL